ncbi:MAG TPA: hypothetical protein VGI93_21795 [Steroidobacteraceae bacterium]
MFLFVRTHSQLQYYLKLADSRAAANETGIRPAPRARKSDNVVEIRSVGRRSLA